MSSCCSGGSVALLKGTLAAVFKYLHFPLYPPRGIDTATFRVKRTTVICNVTFLWRWSEIAACNTTHLRNSPAFLSAWRELSSLWICHSAETQETNLKSSCAALTYLLTLLKLIKKKPLAWIPLAYAAWRLFSCRFSLCRCPPTSADPPASCPGWTSSCVRRTDGSTSLCGTS